MDDAIQLVGGFGVGYPRLAGQAFGDFGFPHAGSMLPGRSMPFRSKSLPGIANILEIKDLSKRWKSVTGSSPAK
jgi:hypothetical protein